MQRKWDCRSARLICASNRNKVLTDFIRTGTYDKNRDFYTTISPSMDILISSNLERLLFDLYDEDDAAVRALYASLAETGSFTVSGEVKEKLQSLFWGDFCDDDATEATIRAAFEEDSYLCDTHTAVAVHAAMHYRRRPATIRGLLSLLRQIPINLRQACLERFTTSCRRMNTSKSARSKDCRGFAYRRALQSLKISRCASPLD